MLEPLRNPREGKHSLPWTFPASQGKHVSVLLVLFLSGGMVQYRSPFIPATGIYVYFQLIFSVIQRNGNSPS